MTLTTYGYNIPYVVIDTALTVNTKTKIGTGDDFSTLLNMVNRGGLIRGKLTIGTQVMDGVMIANPWSAGNGIECYTISMAGAQSPYIFSLEVTLENGDMYVTPGITNLT